MMKTGQASLHDAVIHTLSITQSDDIIASRAGSGSRSGSRSGSGSGSNDGASSGASTSTGGDVNVSMSSVVSEATLEANVVVRNELHEDKHEQHSSQSLSGHLILSIKQQDGVEVYTSTVFVQNILPQHSQTITIRDIVLMNCSLWWPHTHGASYLYQASFSFFVSSSPTSRSSSSSAAAAADLLDREHLPQPHPQPSSTITIRHGIRIVEPFVDTVTKGRAFKINHIPVFLAGGNWIATDQLMR